MKKVLMLAMVSLLLLTCGKLARLYVYGQIMRGQSYGGTPSGEATVMVLSDPVMDTASATLNDKPLTSWLYPLGEGTPMAEFEDTTAPATGVDEKLAVKTDVGNADATVRVPGDFAMTISPADSARVNTDLTISWDASSGAQWFMVQATYDTGTYYYH